MRYLARVFLLGLLILTLEFIAFPESTFSIETQNYDVKVEKGVAASMRDGVKLYATVIRPDTQGKFPVILIRTPYNRERFENSSSFPRYAAQRGYVVIIQDVRGRYSSEGEFLPYSQEINDGYDSVEWAAALPYSNGKVGTHGCSYLGAVQWLLATAGPPHLIAIFPQCCFANGRHFFYYGGAFSLGWISWLYDMIPDIKRRRGVEVPSEEEASRQRTREIWKWYRFLPLKQLPLLKEFCPYYYEWLDNPDDGPYWDFVNIEKKHNQIAVPAYNLSGWFDDSYGQPGAIKNFTGMRKNGKTKTAREGQKLIIGPWTHIPVFWGNLNSKIGDIDFGPEAVVDLNALVIRWFDYWLKGINNGIMDEPPIKIFVMGDNKWRYEQEWPLKRTEFTPFYLHSQGKANYLNGDGYLDREIPAIESPDRYIYDPANPVINYIWEAGPQDQRPIEIRNDVLVYTSKPLARDLEITGPIKAEIWASSSAKDTDFLFMVTDVYPDGYSQNIHPSFGVVRARYRESESKPLLLSPGKIYKFTIGEVYTSHVFKSGHRIRISITSSYFPYIDRNPNTGHPFGEDAELITATQTIYHDGRYPSRIILPIIPR